MLLAYERLSFSRITKLHTSYRTFYEAYRPSNSMGGSDPLDLSIDTSMSIMEIMGEDVKDGDGTVKTRCVCVCVY